MKFDIIGRINNMRLPDGKAAILYSIYEAVSNAVHAIEDRFGDENAATKGKIIVDVTTDDSGSVEAIFISDNGIGFTRKNLDAFDTCDSRFKEARGGKGIGRLIWLKVFEEIKVHSRFQEAGPFQSISFDFAPESENSIQNKTNIVPLDLRHGSRIALTKIRSNQKEKIRKISFLRDLALHFFSYFMAGTMPNLIIIYNGISESLADFIKDKIDKPIETDVIINLSGVAHTLVMSHLFVDSTLSKRLKNSILLTAHHRLVGDPIDIEQKFALNELSDRKAYVGLVKGTFLDDRVDQERMGFKITTEQHEVLKDAVVQAAEGFLSDHIRKMRARQTTTVSLLLQEHPQLAAKVTDIDGYVNNLSPGMDEEQIGENLFTLLYREERKISRRIREFSELESLDEKAQSEAEEVLSKVSDQAKHRLAELVVKRRQVLSLIRSFLRYRDGETQSYHYEKTIHDLKCPLGRIDTSKDYSSHNLWIIDDLLAYYSFFASDKQIRMIATDADSSKEPDIIFFNPLGFHREGTNDPIALVEFKRPGDETPSKDPVDQVLEYIEKLRNRTVRDIEGAVISEIRENTPFECYVICDLTEGTRRLLSRSLAPHETPDGEGYFGFAPNHKAAIHVISFKKMLRDAELRNEVFFNKLGLLRT
jgi:hypothetical protein